MADGPDRPPGVALYVGAATLLAAGALWWVRAAPVGEDNTEVTAWRRMVEEILPERVDQVDVRTYVLRPGAELDAETDVSPGPHLLLLVCAGRGAVQVRFSSGGADTRRRVPCAEDPGHLTVPAALDDHLHLDITAESQDRAVFRWQLVRVLR